MPVDKKTLAIALSVSILATALLVVPIVLWAVTTPKSTVNTSCSTDSDCQGHGVCVNSACKCNSPWGGPFCNVLGDLKDASITAGQGVACSQIPTPCKTSDDCSVCAQDIQYSCQTVSANQNQKGLAGSFCLPTPTSSSCYSGVSTANSIPGFVTWQGWSDVEVQDWTCACEYPNFYPLTTVSTGSGQNTEACSLSPQVCPKGTWNYPCIRDPNNPQTCLNAPCSPGSTCPDPEQKCTQVTGDEYACQLPVNTCTIVTDCPGCGNYKLCTQDNEKDCYTPDQITALCGTGCVGGTCQQTCKVPGDCGDYPCVNGYCVTSPSTLIGANPFEYGMCDCSNQSCTTSADCAGDCLGGKCVNQRVVMNPTSGVPTCVRDTCAPGGFFVPVNIPPYTFGYCECSTGYAAQGNTCVYQGSADSAPSVYCALGCGHGTCAAPGKCTCDPGWNGNNTCTKFSCDKGCGNGVCIGPNTCACDPGYKTDANGSCTQLVCLDNCSGNGTCVKSGTGAPTCQCNPGWSGPTCSTPTSNTCSITLQHQDSSSTIGGCVASSGTCSDVDPTVPPSCTGVYFGNTSSFNSSGSCLGSCTQGLQSPGVAGLPPLLCTSSTSATSSTAPCSTTTCSNTPVPLETCMQNATYPYNCSDLCAAFTALQPFDYNTICKKQPAPTKPAFC